MALEFRSLLREFREDRLGDILGQRMISRQLPKGSRVDKMNVTVNQFGEGRITVALEKLAQQVVVGHPRRGSAKVGKWEVLEFGRHNTQ